MTTATRRSGLIIPRTARAPLTARGIVLPREYRNQLTNGDLADLLSGTVNAFVDTFADLNAWTTTAGSPTVLSNVVTLPANTAMTAGHSEWWDHAAGSQFRWKWATGATIEFYIRYTDATNYVRLTHNGATFLIQKVINNSATAVYTVADVLVNGTFYWFTWTISGTTYTMNLMNDNAGAVGTQRQTSGAQVIADAVLATGAIHVDCFGAGITFGGAFSNVCRVVIPAPPGWTVAADAGVPAFCVSKTTKFSGTYSLSIFNNNAAFNGRWSQLGVVVTANPTTVSGRIKTASVVSGANGARLLDGNMAAGTPFLTGTNDWSSQTHTETPGAGASAYSGQMVLASGTAWFDMLWLAQQPSDTGQRRYNTIRSGWR